MADEQPPTSLANRARSSTLWLTNVTKIVGLVLAVNEMLIRPETNSARLAFVSLVVAGAQLSETMLLAVIDRFLGRSST
jgi:hypothetical protein